MTYPIAFNEVEGFTIMAASTIMGSTTDSSVALNGINRAGIEFTVNNTGYSFIDLENDGPLAEGWFRILMGPQIGAHSGGAGFPISLLDEGGNFVFGIWRPSTSSSPPPRVVRWFGGDPEGDHTIGNSLVTLDFQWKLHPSEGYLRVYQDESLVFEVTGDTIADSSDKIRYIRIGSAGTTGASYVWRCSQLIVSETSTIGGVVHTLPLDAEGAITQWQGDFTDINGTTLDPLATMLTDTPNATHVFEQETMGAIPEGQEINAVIVSASARHAENADVVNFVAIAHDTSGPDTYESADIAPVPSPQAGPVQSKFTTNPNGGIPWTVEDINAYQFGFRAKTA